MSTTKKHLSIIGYSGHSFVCIEIAKLSGFILTGYYEKEEKNYNPYDLEFLGKNPDPKICKSIFISIGNNTIRERLYNELNDKFSFPSIVSPNSVISQSAEILNGNLIGTNVIINPFARIGNATIINTGSIIEHECTIGDFVHIAPGAVLSGNVNIGTGTFVGANAVIKQGIKIGNNVIIGAGTVVLSDIPDNTTIVGNPGKPLIK